MNNIGRVFDVTQQTLSSPETKPPKKEIEEQKGERQWKILSAIEDVFYRITGIYLSDNAAETREELSLVSDIKASYEELKTSEKRLQNLEGEIEKLSRDPDANRDQLAQLKNLLIEAKKDWQQISKTLSDLKGNYRDYPNVTKTASYRKLDSLEKTIDNHLKEFLFFASESTAATQIQEAEDFLHVFDIGQHLFQEGMTRLPEAKRHLDNLQALSQKKEPAFMDNPYNRELKDRALALSDKLQKEMIAIYIENRGTRIDPEVKQYVEGHTNDTYTDEMKQLLSYALNALKRDNSAAYAQAQNDLMEAKDYSALTNLVTAYAENPKRQRNLGESANVGLQELFAKAKTDIAASEAEVNQFVESNANAHFTPEMKQLLSLALLSIKKDNPAEYEKVKEKLEKRFPNYFSTVSELFQTYASKNSKIQSLADKALADVAEIPIPYCLRAIPGLATTPHLVQLLTNVVHENKEVKKNLIERIRTGQETDNILILLDQLNKYNEDPNAVLAMLELDILQEMALEKELAKLSPQGHELLKTTHEIIGSNFHLSTTNQLVLVACLNSPEFVPLYSKLLARYGNAQITNVEKDFRIAPKKSPENAPYLTPLPTSIEVAWDLEINAPLVDSPLEHKMRMMVNFQKLLFAKAGLGEPLVLATNIPQATMSKDKILRDFNLFARPIFGRIQGLNNLDRFAPGDRALWEKEGYVYNKQLDCFEYFSMNLDGNPPFDAKGVRHFTKGTFKVGYAKPEVGFSMIEVDIDLREFAEQDPLELIQFVKAYLDGSTSLELLKVNYAGFMEGLGEERTQLLIERLKTLKDNSDRLLRSAFVSLGNPKITPLEGVTLTPWKEE